MRQANGREAKFSIKLVVHLETRILIVDPFALGRNVPYSMAECLVTESVPDRLAARYAQSMSA